MGIALGVVLACGFVALAGWQRGGGQHAGALIAAGMAAMAAGLSFPGGHFVHGPWWAAAFAVIAIWGWRSASTAEPSEPAGRMNRLVGGLAMVYMCTAWPGPAGLGAPTAAAATAEPHHLAVGPSGGTALTEAGGAPTGLVLPLVGWLLACYFLVHAVGALTRRRRGSASAVIPEAVMGVGMTAMLLAMI